MKQLFFIVFFITVHTYLHSQNNIDQVLYRCTYQTKIVKDTTDHSYFTEDIMHLDIGTMHSIFYSQRKMEKDSIMKAAIEKGSRDMLKTSPKGVNKYIIYQNYPEGKISFLNQFAGKKTNYIYEENMIFPQWNIISEKEIILGYSCQLATCHYKGRNYYAWFTSELPFQFGPYKFGGLPGLILKIYDSEKNYLFEAIAFEKIASDIYIIYDRTGYKTISKKNYQKLERDYISDPIGWINQNSGVKITGLSTPQEKQKEGFREDHYLPLELSE